MTNADSPGGYVILLDGIVTKRCLPEKTDAGLVQWALVLGGEQGKNPS